MSWLLRHGALREGLPMKPDGFIAVKDVLNHRLLKRNCLLSDIERIVANDSKMRYTLRRDANNSLEIKANQGHSMVSERTTFLLKLLEATRNNIGKKLCI